MVHLLLRDHTLRVFDSKQKRLECEALLGDQSRLLVGHYKLTFVERLAPRQKAFGPGRIFVGGLGRRDLKEIVESEHAEPSLDDDRLLIGGHSAPIRAPHQFDHLMMSIHGGGESLEETVAFLNFQPAAFLNYQPLTPSQHGVRIHNAHLAKLMDFLEPRLRCLQITILTICG